MLVSRKDVEWRSKSQSHEENEIKAVSYQLINSKLIRDFEKSPLPHRQGCDSIYLNIHTPCVGYKGQIKGNLYKNILLNPHVKNKRLKEINEQKTKHSVPKPGG